MQKNKKAAPEKKTSSFENLATKFSVLAKSHHSYAKRKKWALEAIEQFLEAEGLSLKAPEAAPVAAAEQVDQYDRVLSDFEDRLTISLRNLFHANQQEPTP